MEPPSSQLMQQLERLQLIEPGELRRVWRVVRRLASGLPVIDSIWIDALVRRRTLTPFQSRWIEQDRAEQLLIGERYLVRKECAPGREITFYEAFDQQSHRAVLVARIPVTDRQPEAFSRLQACMQRLEPARHCGFGLPTDVICDAQGFAIISPYRPGILLSQLMIRRGRLSEAMVGNIAAQLTRQLSQTESLALHGDIRPASVWLTTDGEVSLVGWGGLHACFPEITIHSRLPLESYDSLAPERLDAARPLSPAGEMYAFGSLLWQLLAGRPAWLAADPLEKIRAQQTRTLPDIRSIAPDVSEPLAQLIRQMTAREPHRRPATFHEVAETLTDTKSSSLRLPTQAIRSLNGRTTSPASRGKRRTLRPVRNTALAAGLLIGLTAIAWNRDQLGLPRLSRLDAATATSDPSPEAPRQQSPVEERVQTAMNVATPAARADEVVDRTLPPADANNRIQLAGRSYTPSPVTVTGTLSLTASHADPATIEIGDEPLQLTAKIVRLENIRLRPDPSAANPTQPLAIIRAAELSISGCRIESPADDASHPLIVWEQSEPDEPHSGRLVVRNSQWHGSSACLLVRDPLSAALFENIVRDGSGALLRLQQGPRSGWRVPIQLTQCTFQDSGPVISWHVDQASRQSGVLSLQGANTLLGIADGHPLFELTGKDAPTGWQQHLEVAAAGLVARPELELAGFRTDGAVSATPLDASAMRVDGLLSGTFHFTASGSDTTLSRPVIDSLPVRFSPRDPGAEPKRFPRWD